MTKFTTEPRLVTLEDRIGFCVATANAQLTHWMPFTIVSATPDAGDGLTCAVTIQTDGGDRMQGIFATQFLSPQAIAEAGTRAYLAVVRGLDVWDGAEEDEAAAVTPERGAGWIQ